MTTDNTTSKSWDKREKLLGLLANGRAVSHFTGSGAHSSVPAMPAHPLLQEKLEIWILSPFSIVGNKFTFKTVTTMLHGPTLQARHGLQTTNFRPQWEGEAESWKDRRLPRERVGRRGGSQGQGREALGSTSRWEKVKCRKKSNVFQNWKVAGSLSAGHLDEKVGLSWNLQLRNIDIPQSTCTHQRGEGGENWILSLESSWNNTQTI